METAEPPAEEQQVQDFLAAYRRIFSELEKFIVGHKEILEGVLVAFFAGGHVLLEGVPGLGKTILVRSLARAVALDFSRIQFTPDLMPADIVGTNLIVEDDAGGRHFRFEKGPVFAHIILADEVNRATPKTQSALLEAMQEKQVTIGSDDYQLAEPFFVLATQNPLEMQGTYPLPEAQLDRFFYRLEVLYPSAEEMSLILDRTTEASEPEIEPAIHEAEEVMAMRRLVRQVPVAPEVREHAVRIVRATHPETEEAAPMAKQFVRFGASPRGAQALILAGKIHALLDDRFHVAKKDIERAAAPALNHRILLNFEGEAEGILPRQIIEEAVEKA